MDLSLREGLVEVEGSDPPTFGSPGVEDRARAISVIAADAYSYLAGLLDLRPPLQVLVLSEADWPSKTQGTYGVPHSSGFGTDSVFLAGTEAPLWSHLAELLDPADRPELVATYGEDGSRAPLGRYFDLLAVHEMAHIFSGSAMRFSRFWLSELFANLCLHAWVSERAPDSLPFLLTLPRLGAKLPASRWEHSTLEDFERLYYGVGEDTYPWFHFRFQLEAAAVYERAGSDAIVRLFAAFHLDDAALAQRLEAVDPGLAEFSLSF